MLNKKILVAVAFSLSLLNTNCSTDTELEVEPETTSTIAPETSAPGSTSKESTLEPDKFTSFTVETGGTPIPVSQILKDFLRPRSNYGASPFIDFTVNADNTVTVLWLDTTCSKHLSKISLDTKALIKDIPIPAKANNSGYLGFDALGDDKFIIGYTKDNSHGDKEAEAWYTAFDGSGTELFSTRIWGDENLSVINSKAASRQFGSSVIRYNAVDNSVAIYLAHTMRAGDNVRHQAGWLGFLNGTTGEILKRANGDNIGSGWFFSHNFDQRGMISSQNTFYALAHGDAYPRALGISSWSASTGNINGLNYYDIQNGSTGDNTTLATTGDFAELSDGTVAVVYSTEDGRSKRDLRISIVDGMETNSPSVQKETWLTTLDQEHVGWGSKVAQYDEDHIITGWNTFDDSNKGTGSHFTLTKLDGTTTSETFSLPQTVLYPAQSFKKSADGKSIVFVSEENGMLKVHLIAI